MQRLPAERMLDRVIAGGELRQRDIDALPELGVLGVARASPKVVEIGGKFLSRLTLPLNLVYDHPGIDGAVGARFLALVRELLMGPSRLTLPTTSTAAAAGPSGTTQRR